MILKIIFSFEFKKAIVCSSTSYMVFQSLDCSTVITYNRNSIDLTIDYGIGASLIQFYKLIRGNLIFLYNIKTAFTETKFYVK